MKAHQILSPMFFFFSSRRPHTRLQGDWSSDVCSSDLGAGVARGSAGCPPSTHSARAGFAPDRFRPVSIHGYRPQRPETATAGAPHCGVPADRGQCLGVGGRPGGSESRHPAVLQSAGRAAAPLVCRAGISQTGPWWRPSTGRLPRPRSPYRSPWTTTVISPGRGSGPRAQSRSWPQAGGKKTPEIIDAIEILLEHDTAGDPITGLKWTRKTTENIAEVLQQIDIPVSANTVARLLYPMNFSLRVNRKPIATNSSPYREQQFQHIYSLRTRFQRQGRPVISVDSKKREMIGNFKNGGAQWDRSPVLVNDHDFRSDASGVGISYGIYEPPRNHGTVCVGVSHDTPAFAAHSIATWWKRQGARCYGRTPKLLVLADSGGSYSCTSWLWKIELQAQVCNPFGIAVTIAHYPTGASKWNPIEHRLFSEISKNGAAQPLDSYQKMLKFIRTTSTHTGLAVTAYLDRNEYPTRLKPDPQLISSLRLTPGKVLPRWNYTIRPNL